MGGITRKSVVVALVVVVLTVIIVASAEASRRNKYLSGMWVGSPGFLSEADLSDLQLFLGPQGDDGTRQGYLIMTDLEGNFIANQAVDVCDVSAWRHKPSRWLASIRNVFSGKADSYTMKGVKFTFDETDAVPPFPVRLSMTVSVLDGSMTLYDSEKVYAYLVKDVSASAAAVDAYDS